MLARLEAHGRAAAERLRRRAIARIVQAPAPPGVLLEAGDTGVTLVGRNLRMRLIEESQLRSFGR
jgi:hypothetical protein